MNRVQIISNFDDWGGVYLNGVLVYEGHDAATPPREILQCLGFEYESIDLSSHDDYYFEQGMPNTWVEAVKLYG